MIFALLLLAAIPPAPPAPLVIVKPALRQYEDGPPAGQNFSFVTGESVFVTFQVSGFQVSPKSSVDLGFRVEPVDPQGIPLVEPITGKIQTEISTEDKDWMPIVRGEFVIPPLASPGAYRIGLMVEDRIGGRQARSEIRYEVRGRNVEPSPVLTARNFRFLRSEDDAQPMAGEIIYRGGDNLWARFDMVGFKYGDGNRIHVSYGLRVLGPTGKILYEAPQAAVEQGQSFYPKKYLPGILSLNLQTVQPAVYTLVLTLRDEVGTQTEETAHEFRVER
jgi:hypothetical protein